MRLSHIAIAIFGALCAADQSPVGTNATEVQELLTELAALPACDLDCIYQAVPSSKCDVGDLACLCTDEVYTQTSQFCIASNCTITEALAAQGWQKKACHAPVRDEGWKPHNIGLGFLVTATVVVTLRFLARYRIEGVKIGADDWAVLGAFICLIPSTIIAAFMVSDGALGRDIWTATPEEVTLLLKYFYLEEYFYQVCIYLSKVSIVLLYMRIFPREVGVKFNNICWATLIAMTLWVVAFLVYFPLECFPISYIWTQWDGQHTGWCTDFQTATYVNSAFNIFFDFVLLSLPIPRLAALQVRDVRRKIGVMLTFLVGIFVTICSIVRLQYIARIGDSPNVTYAYNDVTVWSGLEGDVAVTCCCLPVIIGPTARFFKQTVGSTLSSYAKWSSDKSSSWKSTNNTDERTTRLPSSATEHEEYERNYRRESKAGGIEKTVVTSMYNVPQSHSSDSDEVELIDQSPRGRKEALWDV